MRKRLHIWVAVLIALVTAITIFITEISVLWEVKAIGALLNGTACYGLSREEAVAIAKKEYRRALSHSNGVVFDKTVANLVISNVQYNRSKRGDGFSSIDVSLRDKKSHKPALVIEIYEDCELEWRKYTGPDVIRIVE